MYGLPLTTEVNRQLAKKAIYARFDLKMPERNSLDGDISRIVILNMISPDTVPGLQKGNGMEGFYVLQVILKQRDFDEKNIIRLSRLIPQNILFVLCYENKIKFAIYHLEHLFTTGWFPDGEAKLPLEGLNVDTVWENLVKYVGAIRVEDDKSLAEQIMADDVRNVLQKQIEQLERKEVNEKQPQKKFALHKMHLDLRNKLKNEL